jgi:hypothetical protein
MLLSEIGIRVESQIAGVPKHFFDVSVTGLFRHEKKGLFHPPMKWPFLFAHG